MEPSCHSRPRGEDTHQSFESKWSGERGTAVRTGGGCESKRGAADRVASPGRTEKSGFWANCLASSSSNSYGSRFPGVKPNRLLKRETTTRSRLFHSLLSSVARHCAVPMVEVRIRLPFLVTGTTAPSVGIYDNRGQINRESYDLSRAHLEEHLRDILEFTAL